MTVFAYRAADRRGQTIDGVMEAPDARAAKGVFLVAPAAFCLAEESARDNAYMDLGQDVDPTRAVDQHADRDARGDLHPSRQPFRRRVHGRGQRAASAAPL